MPVYQSNELINRLHQQTEEFLNKAINEWQMTSPSKLLKQPAENKWSAAQCIEHLNSYGRYYIPQIEKAIETAKRISYEATEEFQTGLLGNYFTKMMLPRERKLKNMTSPKDHRPATDFNTNKVISEFINQQEKLLVLLEKARKINLNKARVPISIARFFKLRLGDVFMVVIAHNHRHVLQAERAAPTLKGEERVCFDYVSFP